MMNRKALYTATVLLLLFSACDLLGPESGADSGSAGKAAVRIAITASEAQVRTALPAVGLNDAAVWELWAGKPSEPQALLTELSGSGETVYLEAGVWDFTLKGYNGDGAVLLQGTLPEQTIILDGSNTLTFAVAPLMEGEGTFKITIVLPEGHGITRAKVFSRDGSKIAELTPVANPFVFEGKYPAGDHYFSVRLYNKDEALYGVVSETAQIRANLLSETAYTLTAADLNSIYTITYHLEGGELDSPNPGYYRSTDAAFALPEPTRNGYTFEDWRADAVDGAVAAGIPQDSEGDKTFYAKWSFVDYDIFYKPEGINYGENPATYTIADAITLKEPPKRDDFRFDGWHRDESYQDPIIETPAIPAGSTGAQTFYAKWIPVYPIIYELNGGINHADNLEEYIAEDLPFTLKNPTRDEYSFMGWYDDSGFHTSADTTIPEGSTEAREFYARWHKDGESLATTADLTVYIVNAAGGNSAANPVTLPPVNISLADGGWTDLLAAISGAQKFVALDLSAYTMSGTEFDPGTANTGEKYIVSLVLPNAATSFKGGSSGNATFKNFIALASVTGKATSIGSYVFSGVSSGLTTLTVVDFPEATTIGANAFMRCANLTTASLPKATSIGRYAFGYCTNLTTVNLPEATGFDTWAFRNCKLEKVNFPKAVTIGDNVFEGCANLTTVSLPKATKFGGYFFQNCASLTTVTLGSAAPTLGGYLLAGVSNKTVTVKVPTAAVANYTTTWQNKFKEGDANISLIIETYDPEP